MKKRWAPFVLATCLSTALVGCAGNQNDQAANDRNGNDNVQLTRVRTNNQNENNGNGTDHELRVSTRATRNIERMDEVDQANVIIRNNDAYVAVRLKNDDNGGNNNRNGNNNGNGGTNNNDMTGTGRNDGINNNGLAGMGGDTRGTGHMGATGIGGNGDTNNNGTNGAAGNNGGTDDNRIIGMGGNGGDTDNTGGTTRNNNNGGGTGNNGDINGNNYSEVSTKLEQKIADQVRAADKNIHKVYISSDTDFYNQMTDYRDEIDNGNVDGLFEDFGNTVRNFFE